MKVQSKVSFRLRCLKCLLTTERQGDEVYVKYNGRKIWPENKRWHRMLVGEEVVMDVRQPVSNKDDKIEIELWESDFISHTRLGNFVFLLDSVGGPYTVDMLTKNRKAKYSLVWEAIE